MNFDRVNCGGWCLEISLGCVNCNDGLLRNDCLGIMVMIVSDYFGS